MAQASTCSSVVLPAPEGPITANCSPAATASDSARNAAGALGADAGWRPLQAVSCSFMRSRPPNQTRQTSVAASGFNALVVVGLGGHETRGALQLQDFLAFGGVLVKSVQALASFSRMAAGMSACTVQL
jgi:hypothetical protein